MLYRPPLSVGVSLSAEQVAALTHDIVWMEQVEVNGEKVLAPVLYLAHANGRVAPNGALIQGRDVNLISGGDLVNVGTLRATNNLAASATNISNSGLIEAGGRLDMLATDSIRNAQGGIIAGREVSLTALTGDVINERSVTRLEGRAGGEHVTKDLVDTAARIEAANDLTVTAGRDIGNVGGVLKAGGDIRLDAGRDLSIVSQEGVDSHEYQRRRVSGHDTSITQYGSEISAGGNLTATAGQDLSIVASEVEARRDLALQAGRDVTLAAAANEEHSYAKGKKGKTKYERQEDDVEQQSAVVKAGGDLAIDAGRDLRLVASKVSAGEEAYLVAGDKLELLAANDSQYSLYDMSKKGGWGSKQTQRDEVTDVKAVGSEVSSGGDLTLKSGGDQLYQGAKLASGADLTIDSGGAVTFEAVKDLHQESHEKSKGDLAWTSMKGKGNTDETVRQSQLTANGDVLIKAVDGLKVDVKHIDQATISQSIDAMVAADPQLAWLKEAQKRGDVDWRQVKEIHDSFKYSQSGLGAAPSLVIAIVAAAYLGPLTGALASNFAVGTINNGGDIGQGVKFALNKDNLKSYAIAAAAAYVITPQLDKAFGVSTDNINKITKGFDLGSISGITQFGLYSTTQGVLLAGAETVVRGGSFGENLKGNLVAQAGNFGMAVGFNLIGDWALGKYPDGSPQKVMAHALLGGLVAKATGSDFASGAVAAGANEALSKALSSMVGGDENLELMAAQITGLLAVAAIDGDFAKGAEIAKYATAYNQQVHRQAKERLERGLKELRAQGKYLDLDVEVVLSDLRRIADGEATKVADLDPRVAKFLGAEFSPASMRETLFEPEDWERYVGFAIDLLFPSPSGKAAAVQRVAPKISKEALAALEAKFGPDLVKGPPALVQKRQARLYLT